MDTINVNFYERISHHDYFYPQFEMLLTFSFKTKKFVTCEAVWLFIANTI